MENDMTDTIVDKLLLQAIKSNEVKIKEYEVQRIQLQTQMDILSKENKEYLAKYQEMCSHPSSSREQTHYMSGGYDHVSEAQYEEKCDRCGKVLSSKLIRGTYA
jgi:hypothetical protein